MDTIGDRINYIRKIRKLTISTVSNNIHISQEELKDFENNITIPDKEILHQLSKTLGCSIDYILGKDNKVNELQTDNLKLALTLNCSCITKEDYDYLKSLLSDKIHKVIQKKLDCTLKNEVNYEITDEEKSLLRASLEYGMLFSRLLNKVKYTPEKYRKGVLFEKQLL